MSATCMTGEKDERLVFLIDCANNTLIDHVVKVVLGLHYIPPIPHPKVIEP